MEAELAKGVAALKELSITTSISRETYSEVVLGGAVLIIDTTREFGPACLIAGKNLLVYLSHPYASVTSFTTNL